MKIVLILSLGIGLFSCNPSFCQYQNNDQSNGNVMVLPGRQGETEIPLENPRISPFRHQQEEQAPEIPLWRQQSSCRQFTVTVTDDSHRYVPDLSSESFRLFKNKEERPVCFFLKDVIQATSIGIIIDRSSSMQNKLPTAVKAIKEFLDQLDSRDEVFLESFDDKPHLMQAYTTNHKKFGDKLDKISVYSNTALYDTIADALDLSQYAANTKRVLLVVTDGMDTASTRYNLASVTQKARALNVLIYGIGIGDPEDGGADAVDAQGLKTLSAETGAMEPLILPAISDGSELQSYFNEINLELRNQYTLGFPAAPEEGYEGLIVTVPALPGAHARIRKEVSGLAP